MGWNTSHPSVAAMTVSVQVPTRTSSSLQAPGFLHGRAPPTKPLRFPPSIRTNMSQATGAKKSIRMPRVPYDEIQQTPWGKMLAIIGPMKARTPKSALGPGRLPQTTRASKKREEKRQRTIKKQPSNRSQQTTLRPLQNKQPSNRGRRSNSPRSSKIVTANGPLCNKIETVKRSKKQRNCDGQRSLVQRN